MSTTGRILSGSMASWLRILISIVSQVILVPIYLTYWPVELYGIWLAIQAVLNILCTLDKGFQNYLGFEFLKIGKDRREHIAEHLWSGVVVGAMMGTLQVVIIIACIFGGFTQHILGEVEILHEDIIRDAGFVLFFNSFVWLLSGSIGGIFGRVLAPFGYYPRMSWWGVWSTIITSTAPVVAIMFGANLLGAGIAIAAATIFYNIPLYIDMFRLLKKERIGFVAPSIKMGFKDFMFSLALSGKDLLETTRQQGARLILAPLSGAVGLAAFSTMRTVANIALQGLGTLTNPLMPELMSFLHNRDQQRTEAALGTVWMIVALVLAPGVVIFQVFAEFFFETWTRNKIVFDPILFASLSLGVLVYAIAQPAISIIKGNNLLKIQVVNSAIAAVLVVVGMFVLVPLYGIVGAGYSLLFAECITASIYTLQAKKWIESNGMHWPKKAAFFTNLSVLISAGIMLAMILLPRFKWIFLIAAAILFTLNNKAYISTLPPLAIEKILQLALKIPGLSYVKKKFID